MRSLLVAGVLLGLCSGAGAQQPPPALEGVAAPGVTLKLTVEQTKLIVDTLGAIGCQNVTQLTVCEQARDLLRDIQRQAREQLK